MCLLGFFIFFVKKSYFLVCLVCEQDYLFCVLSQDFGGGGVSVLEEWGEEKYDYGMFCIENKEVQVELVRRKLYIFSY